MIIDSKVLMHPPPPYVSSAGLPPFPSASSPSHTLTTLPSHLLLQIVYATFPQAPLPDQAKVERQRKTLYWLSVSLRLVDRTLYVACMHVLRSTHIPAYDALIRPPYTSDPFPLLAPPTDTAPRPSPYASHAPPSASARDMQSPLNTLQRETTTLDRFIALKVREDVWADESELHLERDEAYKDVFDLAQPRSRLEDLVRVYGEREGVVRIGAPPTSSSSSSGAAPQDSVSPFPVHPAPKKARITPVPFHLLSVSFSPRQVGLVLHPARRTVVSVTRTREEKLEVTAKRLVRELRMWLEEGG
ncbi:hypothetical protein FPV67DRAFT_1697859 [Lyophyllum atratum]|nr:hypothetical protein FPV67DRAFT_1697859 [Lyophyllum atratum]